MLGRDVGGRSGEDAIGNDGKIVDDGCARLHERERGLGNQECAGEIGLDDILPEFERELIYGEVGVRNAGVVDENMDALELFTGGAE